MKRLVYDNHVRDRSHLSAGLNVYPCDDCDGWHFGHLPQTPTVYHYDTVSALDRILRADALAPQKPIRVPKDMQRKYSGAALTLLQRIAERAPMVWFTWSATWDFRGIPHPGAFEPSALNNTSDALAANILSGIMRISVRASVAKLRWSDWLTANQTPSVEQSAARLPGRCPPQMATAPITGKYHVDGKY